MNVPSGYTALDLVGFTDRGTYSNLTNYVKNDLVHYGGDIWKCLLDDTTNKTPAEGTYWTLWIDNNTTADSVSYNNTQSGLSATNVKGAIDEVSSDIQTLSNHVNNTGVKNFLDLTLTHLKTINTNGTWNGNVFTRNGVSFTVNSDGTITANGTNSSAYGTGMALAAIGEITAQKYILSGCPDGGSSSTYSLYTRATGNYLIYDTGEGIVDTFPYSESTIAILIGSGATVNNVVFKPCVSFERTNSQLTNETNGLSENQFENGAVNELLCDATSNVQTGLTYIVEDDGTITVSGTNTSNETAQIAVTMSYIDWDSTKRYKISGCPSNGSSSSYRLGLTIVKSGNRWSRTLTELGDGLEFQLASDEKRIKVSINISAGYAISDTLTFKPMITVADMPNSDYAHYVPYCKSNKELTSITDELSANLAKKYTKYQIPDLCNVITIKTSANYNLIKLFTNIGEMWFDMASGSWRSIGKVLLNRGDINPTFTYSVDGKTLKIASTNTFYGFIIAKVDDLTVTGSTPYVAQGNSLPALNLYNLS